jgi:hypothetical protein
MCFFIEKKSFETGFEKTGFQTFKCGTRDPSYDKTPGPVPVGVLVDQFDATSAKEEQLIGWCDEPAFP